MIKPNEVDTKEVRRWIKIMFVGPTGSGKTYNAGTFPKSYFAITEPGGEETLLNNPHLKKNVVGYDCFIPKDEADTKRCFEDLDKACIKAREMAEKGEIETFVLDNFTYLSENRWIYINKYEPLFSSKTGETDTRGMYGNLGRWLYGFTLMKLLSMPCNVVVNVHERMENEEILSKKPDKTTPIVPAILGGFRDEVGGMFSAVMFLGKVPQGNNKYKYLARTNVGGGKQAKNRWNLDEIIENVSYDTIRSKIEEGLQPKGVK